MTQLSGVKTGIYFTGEFVADLIPSTENPRQLNASLGGSSYFGAKAVARLAKDAARADIGSFFLGNISQDFFGQLCATDLEEAGVHLNYARKAPCISMLALVTFSETGNSFEFYGRQKPNMVEDLTLSDLPAQIGEEAQLYAFGSIIMNFSPSRQALEAYAHQKAEQGHLLCFDPNTRPSTVPDRQAYRDRLFSYAKIMSVMKASEEDLAWTFPKDSPQDVAQRFLDKGAQAFIVTLGKDGCLIGTRHGFSHLKTKDLGALPNTVGAGDNFNAGVLFSLARRGLVTPRHLQTLSQSDWSAIAADANQASCSHLLSQNKLGE